MNLLAKGPLLTAAVLSVFAALAAPSAAAAPGGIRIVPTRSGCGVATLSTAGKPDMLAVLRSASVGFRVVYVRQAGASDVPDLLGVRVPGISGRPGEAEPFVLGAVGVTLPRGRYRVCVFSDRPHAVELPVTGMHTWQTIRTSPVPSSAGAVRPVDADSAATYGRLAFRRVRTTSTSLVVAAAGIRLPAAPVDTYNSTTCVVPVGAVCDNGSPAFGFGEQELEAGNGGIAQAEYWANPDTRAGVFSAGYEYRGTRRPASLDVFVLNARV
jgi:hypothetical protein